jgi:Tfp pilus assembly protein PilZ
MQILKARFRTRNDFLSAYSSELPDGGLFVPTTTPLKAGTGVVIELNCDGLPNKVLIRATVHSWRPALPRLRVRAGAVLAFDPNEKEKREFVLSTLGGIIKDPPRRKHTRIPVHVPVRFRQIDTADSIDGNLTEISIGGALLRAHGSPPVGTELILSLMPPGGAAPMEIEGKVTYVSSDGGAGVKFTFRDGGGSRRLRELIRRIRIA